MKIEVIELQTYRMVCITWTEEKTTKEVLKATKIEEKNNELNKNQAVKNNFNVSKSHEN